MNWKIILAILTANVVIMSASYTHVDSFFAHVFNARIGRGQY